MDVSLHNICLVARGAGRKAEAFRVVRGAGASRIEKNTFIAELFLRVKHATVGGGTLHRQALWKTIDHDSYLLQRAEKQVYVDETTHACTEVFEAVQRFNYVVNMQKGPHAEEDAALFRELHITSQIIPKSCPRTAAVEVTAAQALPSKIENIPDDQQPHIHRAGPPWHRHQVYHYNEADKKISHGKEAARIFLSTQGERLLSVVGRVVEAVARVFGQEVTFFSKHHYFRAGETDGEIYAKDAPLAAGLEKATSYWVGHATCLFQVPLKADDGTHIPVNIISDPVEGDLNKILYPRMTRAARSINKCPVPHVYMLSHNHLDHYSEATIKKLRKYQPIMLVPEGDADKFRALGFRNIHEHNWWETTTLSIKQGERTSTLQITAVPAHHWSGQGPCDGHHAAFLGYVIHKDEGDIYFAGDTARLTEGHIELLRNRFNIRTMFQPGGPDEARKDMESTHQASVDGLWMHFNLMLRHLYEEGKYASQSKNAFMQEALKLRTIYMHTKTYKLGNLHFDDTESSIAKVRGAVAQEVDAEALKSYEQQVCNELLAIGKELKFKGGVYLTRKDIVAILNKSIIVPKIGSRTEMAS